MSISMLGIAAIMGAGGLGLLVFRAINNLNVGLAASAGLALFVVAVVLDRISQREDTDGMSLWTRVREAWDFKADPEGLMELREERLEAIGVEEVEAEEEEEERYVPVEARERMGLLIAAAGGLIASVATLLPWNGGSGAMSSWSRRVDQDLASGTIIVEGDAETGVAEVVSDGLFGGLEASGGSWFGYVVLGFSLVGFFWALRPMLSFPKALAGQIAKLQGILLAALSVCVLILLVLSIFDVETDFMSGLALVIFVGILLLVAADTYVQGNARAGADGVALLGIAAFGTALAFFLMAPNPLNVEYTREFGSVLAIIGTGLLAIGGIMAVMAAEYTPRRPLPVSISWGRIFGTAVGLILVLGGMFASWSVDERTDVLITPEIQAEIDTLRQQAIDEPALAAQNAQIISNIVNSARKTDKIILYGWVEDGAKLGIVVTAMAVVALAVAIPSSGLTGGGERRRWQYSAILSGIGLAILAIAIAWIASLARTADPKFISGAGTLLTTIGGFLIFVSGRAVLNEFRRKRVYADHAHAAAEELVHELEDAGELELQSS
ncbi:MAG: hypothetical protein EX269_04230 [Acidimicrobiales bacterium]|nr:MAG: hypothetical protein EX269_04230 [Acidimicrobiales bacterium]